MIEKIKALNEKILREQEDLIRLKLQEIMRRIKEGQEQVKECNLSSEELCIFESMLEKAGLKNGINYLSKVDSQDMEYYFKRLTILVEQGSITFGEDYYMPGFMDWEELDSLMDEHMDEYGVVSSDYDEKTYSDLSEFDFEKIGITIEKEISQSDERDDVDDKLEDLISESNELDIKIQNAENLLQQYEQQLPNQDKNQEQK